MNKLKIKFFGSDIYANKIIPSIKKLNWAKIVKSNNFDIGLVADYGYIFNSGDLKKAKYGFFNIHPSKLPLYRGPTPLQTMIIDGVKVSTVTLIKMNTKIDDGEIIQSCPFNIDPSDTTKSLKEKTAIIAPGMLDSIYRYINNEIKPKKQNNKKATYTKKIQKNDCKIDLNDSITIADRKIRACYPNPKAYITFDNVRLIIHKAKLTPKGLKIITIQKEGKNIIPFKNYLSGEKNSVLLDKLVRYCYNKNVNT